MSSRPLRIAISGWFWDRPETGTGQYVQHLVTSLALLQPGVEWVVLVPRGVGPPASALAPNLVWMPLPAHRNNPGKLVWEQLTVPKAAVRLHADLLHIPYWAGPWCCPVPTVVTILDLIPLLLSEYRGSLLVRAYTRFVSATARRASLIVTDSDSARLDIERHLHIAPEKVRVIPLAADSSYSEVPECDDSSLGGYFGVPSGYILYLGGFDVRKNLGALFRAYVQVLRDVPEAHLVVAGMLPRVDSAFAPDPRRLEQEAGVPDGAVSWLGFVAEVDKAKLYWGARVFVFPSRYEGFGLPPLEAMACGVPVVGSATSSLGEVVGRGGILVDPDDVDGLAAAVRSLLLDAELHRQVSSEAVAQAARFSWTQTAEETWLAYQQVLADRGREPGT